MKPCEICDEKGKGMLLYQLNSLNVIKCKRCNLVYIDENFSRDELINNYYASDIYKEYGVSGSGFSHEEFALKIAEVTKKEIDKIKKYTPHNRLLDVGCARGYFLDYMRSCGYEVYGVDVSEYEVKYAKEKFNLNNVFCGELKDANYPPSYFDIITFWDVLEHMQHPAECLKEANRILKKDGIIALTVPNFATSFKKIAHIIYKLGKMKYPATLFYSYHHLFHFTPDTLIKLLNKAGFSSLEIKTEESYSTKLLNYSLLKTIIIKLLVNLDKLLNTSAKIKCYARK